MIRLLPLFGIPVLAFAQTPGTCAAPFQTALQPGRHLAVHVRSGGVEIAGSAQAMLRVTCRNPANGVKISFAADNLRIYGGPDNRNLHFLIEVPEKTNLLVRSPAGDMNIRGVTGDKDVEMNAGDLTILVGDPSSYRVVEGSLWAGDLNAAAFGIVKDGLFRSFRKENAKGQYQLRAHLMAGDLTLK